MLLRTPPSDNILIWYIFVFLLTGFQVPASENPSTMTTKLHQKLIDDIRLHKRLVGLLDEQDKGYKQRPGSYQSPIERIQTHHKQSGRTNEAFREDYEDKLYISGDRRNSRLERERSIETSSSRYELVPFETPTNSKSIKPFEGGPMNYSFNDMAEYVRHQQQSKINSINKKRLPTVSNGIASTRHRNSDRADDGSHLGGFANPIHHHNHNHIAKKSHHRHMRSFDLGEINRQCFSDSDIVQNNNAQGRSYLQLSEIPRDNNTQKLEHIFKERSEHGCSNLVKGAMDLEESLRILAKFQKATGNLKAAQKARQSVDFQGLLPHFYEAQSKFSFDGRSEQPRLSLDGREVAKTSNFNLKDAIRASLNRQKMLYSKKSDGLVEKKDNIRPLDSIRGSNSGTQQIDNKKRIPNVIARLMGLEELPSDSRSPEIHHTNSKPFANTRIAVVRSDLLTQASRSSERNETTSKTLKPKTQQSNSGPISLYASDSRKLLKDSGNGQKGYNFMDGEDYQDTIKAALRQIKQQAPPKPSFEEELYLKLNRLYAADHQMSEQQPKTLKQILESMQMKGILHSGPDQVEPKVGKNDNVVHMKEDVQVLKPVIEMKKGTRKVQDHHHERPFQTSSLQESETPTTRNPNPTNKVSFKGVATSSPSPPSIVIIKPVTLSSQKAQNPPKSTELHPKTPKHGNLVKNMDAQKKISLSELNRSVDDGESKNKNTKNSSVSDGPLQRSKQRTKSAGDGVLQKQTKSQKPRPPLSSELTKKRNERISKTNNNKGTIASSGSKTEKQKLLQKHSKPKVSVSRPRPSLSRASTDRISSETEDIFTRSSHMRGELSQLSVDQNGSSISDVENNIEEEREKPAENPDQVEGIEIASEDENPVSNLSYPVSNLSSRTDKHQNNSFEDAVTVSTISPVSVLELSAEADPQEVEEEEEEEEEEDLGAVPTTDNEIEEEEEHLASHIKDSDDKTDIFPSQHLSNYGHETKLTPPLFDKDEMDSKEYVWQMIAKNIIWMDNACMEAEQTDLYSRLYHKLEEMEIPSFGGLDVAYKRGQQPFDVLERRLVLDCAKELLQRKKRFRLQMKQPLLSSRKRRVSLGLKRSSIPDLVQELRNDVAELRSYQQLGPSHDDVKNETLGEDFLYGVLQKDLSMGSTGASSIWNPSWDNGLYGEEQTHDCAREIENMVFDELLEEIICDIGSV